MHIDINKMDKEAREAGFLVAYPGEESLYFRQITETVAIFIERERENRYICYRLTWEYEPDANGVQRIKDKKVYYRGSWSRAFHKAKRVVDFWEQKVLKKG